MVPSLRKNSASASIKLNIRLPPDLALPLVGLYLREMKTYVHTKYMYVSVCSGLFIVVQTGNSSNAHPEMNGVQPRVEYSSTMKRNESLGSATLCVLHVP